MISYLLDEFGTKFEDELDIKSMVEEKIKNFSSEKLELLLKEIMKKEFRFIELVGAVIGLFIGIVQVLLFNVLSF